MGSTWRDEHEAAVVKAVAQALSRDVLRLWRGEAGQTANPTWSGFMTWTRSLLAKSVHSEAEKALEMLLTQGLRQGKESIQKHNVAFNRLVQKLQGETAQSQATLIMLYRNSLSEDFAEHSFYDASGQKFASLSDLQQHLLKHEGIMKNRDRDVSLARKLDRSLPGGKRRKFLGKRVPGKTPDPEPTIAAMQGQSASQPKSKREAGGREQAKARPQDANHKNPLVSNQQYEWLRKNGFCTFCTGQRSTCCPSHADRCMQKRGVEEGSEAQLAGCPGWK